MIKSPAVFGFGKACDRTETPLPSTLADWTNAIGVVEELLCAAAALIEKQAQQANIAAKNAKPYLHSIVTVSLEINCRGPRLRMHLICQFRKIKKRKELGVDHPQECSAKNEKILIKGTFMPTFDMLAENK